MITLAQVKQELDITGTGYDDLITWLISSIQSVWEQMTNKTWASTTHLETLSGIGERCLFLNNPPVLDISYISVGENDAMSIQNTSSNSRATVSVLDTGLVLNLNGVSDSTVLFATYTTIADVVSAVNALGSNWTASAYNDQGGWYSSHLLNCYGRSCSETALDLSIPGEYLEDFEVDVRTGGVKSSGFIAGTNNIRVKYTAGYTTSTCPDWLKQTLIRQVAHWYMQSTEKRWHVSSMSLGDGGTIGYNKDGKNDEINLLSDFKNMASMHRKINV